MLVGCSLAAAAQNIIAAVKQVGVFRVHVEFWFRAVLRNPPYLHTDRLGESGEWMNFFCSAAAVPYLVGNVTVSAFQ